MEQKQMDRLLFNGEYEEVINQLTDVDYDEYSMLTLTRAYLCLGEEKTAKKLLQKLARLYPMGEYWEEEKRLRETIESGEIEKYISELRSTKKEHELNFNYSYSEKNLVDTYVKVNKKVKEERIIPRSIKECFQDVIGLESVQIELDKFYKLLRFQNERKERDFGAELLKSTHFIISGARGSGKTLVGRIIAKLLFDFGIRAEKEPVCLGAQEILMAYEKDGPEGINHLFSQFDDSTIIVENIQNLVDDIQNDLPRAMLISIEKILKDEKNNLSIILTGTTKAVHRIMAINETMIDVFYRVIEIPQYSTTELVSIARKIANGLALEIHKNTEQSIIKIIDSEKNSSEFMNGITIKRMLEEAAIQMAERYYENNLGTEADMVFLMPEDFKAELEEKSVENLLKELDALTGLQAVKNQIKKRIRAVQIKELAQQIGAERKNDYGSLHMVFIGNPGTGKTTVARIIGKIYQQLGVLPRGNKLIECTRSDLVGEYVGQTARLVQEKVKEAIGGVLFIDEAYALCRGRQDSFGCEAVDELIAAIENNKDNMMVILAGYRKEMKDFLKINAGLSSRIKNYVEFEDYTVNEMVQIFNYMVGSKKMKLETGTEDSIIQLIEEKSKIPDFGNARGIRNLFEEIVDAMNERILRNGLLEEKEELDTIKKEDIESLIGKEKI